MAYLLALSVLVNAGLAIALWVMAIRKRLYKRAARRLISKAAKLVERMEKQGVVGPQNAKAVVEKTEGPADTRQIDAGAEVQQGRVSGQAWGRQGRAHCDLGPAPVAVDDQYAASTLAVQGQTIRR